MANNNDLKIILSAVDNLSPTLKKTLETLEQVNQNVAKLSDTSKSNAEQTKELNNSHIKLAAGLQIVVTAAELAEKAFSLVEQQLEKAIEEALQAEKANNLLVGSLVSTGQYAESTAESLKELAEEVEHNTGVDGEFVKSHIAIGIQMGLTVGKAKELEEASRRLSVLTGGDVNQAFSILQGTLSGQSRALGRLLPQVKELGSAQLQSGAAIDIVNASLKAQYEIYQGSFSAGLSRAQTSINNVYKEIGNIIVQSPIIKQALNSFTSGMNSLTEMVKQAGIWIKNNEDQIASIASSLGKATLVLGGFSLAMGVAGSATTALGAAFTFLTGPIGLSVAAVTALTVAFEKWPGLFDIIVGGLKEVAAMFIQQMSNLTAGASSLASIFNNNLAKSLDNVHTKLQVTADSLGVAGAKQIDLGIAANKAAEAEENLGNKAAEAGSKEKQAAEEALKAASARQAAILNTVKIYGEYEVGTEKQRKALELEKETRDKDLKEFQTYYSNKVAVAVSAEAEQAQQIASFKAKALGGPDQAGPAGAQAAAQAEILVQQNKQAQLKALLDEELITRQEYNQAIIASDQARYTAEYAALTANDAQISTALGQSEQGLIMRKNILAGQLELSNQMIIQQAQATGASQEQIDQIRIEQSLANKQRMSEIDEQYLQNEVIRQQKIGSSWDQTLAKIQLAQKQHGTVMGTLQAVQSSQEFQAVNTGLSNLASLRGSKNKSAFELGKKAAIAQATVQTALAATEAFASLASIPIVGPVLGAAAAAAAVAAGVVQIQNIQSQQFNAQAHGGMDEVPSDLNNKTFILKAGERVVQPEANKDLTAFLASQRDQKTGSTPEQQGKGGAPVIVQLTVNGTATQSDMRNTTDMLIQELRRASERGQLIISSKGVY